MIFTPNKIEGSFVIDLNPIVDERGFFSRVYCKDEFLKHNINNEWVQSNQAFSRERGTLRGIHFQKRPFSEAKLVKCIRGSIWDVCVDLRERSASFGEWFGTELSESNKKMLFIPEGCAHGYLTLENNSELIYQVSNFYNPSSEVVLSWNDPTLDIQWPINPIHLSEKDQNGNLFKNLDL